MRVAHTNKYKKEDGSEVEQTTWVDVTMNNPESKVIPFLKAGVKVFVRGNASLRVYSSQKDRCMKAGLTINAVEVELCGGMSELVPKQLVVPETGALVDVKKYYQADIDTSKFKKDDAGYPERHDSYDDPADPFLPSFVVCIAVCLQGQFIL